MIRPAGAAMDVRLLSLSDWPSTTRHSWSLAEAMNATEHDLQDRDLQAEVGRLAWLRLPASDRWTKRHQLRFECWVIVMGLS